MATEAAIGAYGDGATAFQFVPKGASRLAIDRACETFGITAYQLGRLLDVPYGYYVYQWRTTRAYGKEMSQKFAMRMMHLWYLHSQGVNLAALDGYDWNTDKVSIYQATPKKQARPVPRAKRRNGASNHAK